MMEDAVLADRPSKVVKSGSVVRECCERAISCRLHLLHSGHVINTMFQDRRAGLVVLRINPSTREDSLQTEALCCVAFPFLQSLYAFVACVKHVRDGEFALEVHFDEPSTLTITNLRRSYRVPVMGEADIELLLHLAEGVQISGTILNISESGFEATLPNVDGQLKVDTEVICELRFRGDTLCLAAVIRRRMQAQFALQFTLTRAVENRPTIVAIQKIVRTLEQLWLKSRKRELRGVDVA